MFIDYTFLLFSRFGKSPKNICLDVNILTFCFEQLIFHRALSFSFGVGCLISICGFWFQGFDIINLGEKLKWAADKFEVFGHLLNFSLYFTQELNWEKFGEVVNFGIFFFFSSNA